ncbi:MAG: hypothetical protein IKZ45_07825 [Fibrobacter sp.]|nr:hypothetical protein [Fibrobacter sp.]
MSICNYEEFLKDPLKLDERLPTIEEVLLATNHFFVKTNDDLFNTITEKINDSRNGKRKFDWEDIPRISSCFDFGSLDNQCILWAYQDIINAYSTQYTYKNEFICAIMMNVFLKRWNLENGLHWLKDRPKEKKPFTNYLKGTLAPTLQKTNNKVKDNYRKWIENSSTPSIKTFLEFWESVADSVKDNIIPQKEILFAYWFWQKFLEDFKIENTLDENSLDATGEKFTELSNILTCRKKLDSLEKAEKLLSELKAESFSGMYPFILLLEIHHLIYQKKYKDIISRLVCMSKIFFSMPIQIQKDSYKKIVSCIAHLHQCDFIDKDSKKKLISIFKDLYEKGINYELMDSTPLSKDSKENIDANIRRWSRRFEELFPRSLFYEIPRKVDISFSFPRPNVKKADRLFVSVGECLNSPQISFFSRINDLDAVNKLLENKTIQVTKIGEQKDSAIFWSLVNMSIMNPYGFFLQTIFPPTAKYWKREDVLKCYLPYTKKHSNESEYIEAYAQQINVAKEIFFNLVNRCKKSPLRNKSLDDFETGFSTTKVGNESILQNAIYTANFDIVKSVIDLYKHFVPNSIQVQNWINEKVGYAPSPAIYHLVRIFSEKQHVDLHLEEPLFHYNKPVDNTVNAEYQQILYPTLAASIPEKIQEVEQQRSIALNTGIARLFTKNHFVIINKFVHEEECLKILQLLLDNGADPLIEINMEHEDNGPKSYNAIKYAIEIGWLEGVKMMCEHLMETTNINQDMLNEWLKVGIGWEDQWSHLWRKVPYSEKYAKKCHEVVAYLNTLNPT